MSLIFVVAISLFLCLDARKRDTVLPSFDSLDNEQWRQNNRVHDVCVLGAGASGMSAAVFLKDKNYDVLVLEKEARIGGHCDTDYFTPPAPGKPGYIDLGVQIFTDTAFDNASGFGVWNLSSRAFAQRFLPAADGILPNTLPLSTQSNGFAADFLHAIFLGPAPASPPTPEFLAAFNTLFGILTQYSWLETGDFPDPIPPALLVPFDYFIYVNNLTALGPLFYGSVYIGGLGNFSDLTTLYALQNMRRGILMLSSVQASGFAINRGCAAMYSGMKSYVGGQNVITNAEVLRVERPPKRSNRPTRLITRINNTDVLIKCRDIIVSFPQTVDNLNFFQLTTEERDLFSQVRVRNYYEMKLNITGAITASPDTQPWFTLANINVMPLGTLSPFPTIMAIKRDLNYGPGAGYAFDNGNLTHPQMTTVVQQLLANLNFGPTFSAALIDMDRHQFQPHFTVASLSQSPTPYTRFDALQGDSHTYYIGALRSFSETSNIWQKTFNLINQYF